MTKLFVTVKAKAKENRVLRIDETHFRVQVKSPPVEGKANQAVIETLSDYFGLPQLGVRIIRGHKSKNKVVEIR